MAPGLTPVTQARGLDMIGTLFRASRPGVLLAPGDFRASASKSADLLSGEGSLGALKPCFKELELLSEDK